MYNHVNIMYIVHIRAHLCIHMYVCMYVEREAESERVRWMDGWIEIDIGMCGLSDARRTGLEHFAGTAHAEKVATWSTCHQSHALSPKGLRLGSGLGLGI